MFTIPFQSMLNNNEEMKDEYVAMCGSKDMFATLPIPQGLSGSVESEGGTRMSKVSEDEVAQAGEFIRKIENDKDCLD